MARKVFMIRLSEIQPSQLYICSEKLSEVMKTFDGKNPMAMEPIPVKKLGEDVIYVDGHTRALRPFSAVFQRFQFIGRMRSWIGTPTKSVLNGVRWREYSL